MRNLYNSRLVSSRSVPILQIRKLPVRTPKAKSPAQGHKEAKEAEEAIPDPTGSQESSFVADPRISIHSPARPYLSG